MDQFLQFIKLFVGDATIFALLQLFIFFLFIYAITAGRKKKISRDKLAGLRTGDLVLAYTIMSAAIIQSVGAVDIFAGFKLSITITNLVAAFYLCFFSPWFQGILARVSVKMGRKVA